MQGYDPTQRILSL